MVVSIRTKLFMGFGITLFFVTILGGTGWWCITTLLSKLQNLHSDSAQLSTAQNALWQLRYGFPQFMVLGEEDRKKIVGDETKWYKQIEEAIHAYAAGMRTSEEQQALKEWEEVFTKYVQARPRWFELYGAGKIEEAAEWRAKTTTPYGAGAVKALVRLIELQQQVANEKQQAAATVAQTARRMQFGILVGTLAVGFGTACFLSRRVVNPLAQMIPVVTQIAAGDLGQTITHQSRDEVGILAMALRDMSQKLQHTVAEVREATAAIISEAAEIVQGNSDLSHRTQEQASALEETASSMEEITSTVKQNADNAHQANQLAANARTQAEQGGAVVSKAVAAMADINHSSKKIADIISVIDGIAFQTNLLALNAAVEAARAGEQGRGFAVVADEVRKLAQRSAEAAKEIKTLIGDSVAKVEGGTRLVDETGQVLTEIVTAVKKVSDIVAEIAAASQEQSTGIEHVNKAVMQMDEMTQQNAALVEEAAAASEAVDAQAQSLRQLMAFFKVDTQTDETGPRVTASVVHPPVQPGKKPVSRPGSASSPGASKPGAMRQETMARQEHDSPRVMVAANSNSSDNDWVEF